MENIVFYKPYEKPFELFGLFGDPEKNGYCRLPDEVAKATGDSVARLHKYTSGGRVRFKTDSKKIVLKIKGNYYSTWHTTPMMRRGADVYVDTPRGSTFVGAMKNNGELESIAEITMPQGENEVTVFMQRYATDRERSLFDLPDPQPWEGFVRLWTLREALAKQDGRGQPLTFDAADVPRGVRIHSGYLPDTGAAIALCTPDGVSRSDIRLAHSSMPVCWLPIL